MDDDDNGFFILVLGVLAAIVTLVSWWGVSGGFTSTTEPIAALDATGDSHAEEAAAEEDGGHDADADHDHDDHDGEHHDHDAEHADDHDGEHDDHHAEHADSKAGTDEATEATATDATDADSEDGAALISVANAVGGDTNLSMAAALIDAAGLRDTLAGDGPFTVLAPSNAAIEGVDPAAAARLLGGDGVEELLRYHVLGGTYTVDDLAALAAQGGRGAELETLHGDPITLSIDGDQLVINGNVSISATDDAADNGLVHTIENILVPRQAALNLIVGLEPIRFASASSDISDESTSTLDRMVEALIASDVAVTVEGHTDDQGDAALNQALSLDRARAVVNYFVANGVAEDRLGFEGLGSTEPVADNDTAEGRALNRRIEFRIDA